MDHFENIIATLLEAENYWVRRSFKVNVTRDEKYQIGKHTIPRPEIDLLAFNVINNQVIAFEAKSYFDSTGVKLADLTKEYDVPQGRYKLFTSQNYRKIVLNRLKEDLKHGGMANDETTITLGLAAGNVHSNQSFLIREYMDKNKWAFWSQQDIKDKVTNLANNRYENNTAIITAKILLR